MILREHLAIPSPQQVRLHSLTVDIVHPDCKRPLFSLPAFSAGLTPSGDTQYGVDHRLVLDACRVLTNRAAKEPDGYIAHDCAGHQRLSLDTVLLRPGRYFYHLASPQGTGTSTSTSKYPIVGDMTAWRFPESIPSHWIRNRSVEEQSELYDNEFNSSSSMSTAVLEEDKRCIITRYRQSCENARLVPQDQGDWFYANDMSDYNLAGHRTGVNDVANGVTLRSDVHRCLDRHSFVFYPVDGGRFAAYFVRRGDAEYAELFHRRPVDMPIRVSDQFLYARFAYTVINLLHSTRGFDLAPTNEEVERLRADRLSTKKALKVTGKQAQSKLEVVHEGVDITMSETSAGNQDAEGANGTDTEAVDSESSVAQPMTEDLYATADKRYRDRFLRRFPDQAVEEVDNPPESLATSCHTDTPRMLRLMSEYIKNNPQVWKASWLPADATRPDVEGYCAGRITRSD
ncbi:hypothetical protein BD309DRAFT_604981 [Dichomitus squalens]|uniref:Uncharacterized protein n=1 Tax=Dichomitus squalens TaxID=114155 RepID=A0A4Q9NBA8_9APHY|nr:hypothetical protein BD311DRAFT_778906 [Dichomitus squalens]TBU37605.1 hypothetical protein BD309DRAFT_604981 [Dichomitus squalens]